jgi:hypothetical protein
MSFYSGAQGTVKKPIFVIAMLLANMKGCKKLSRGRFARFRPSDSFLQPFFYFFTADSSVL